MRRVSRPSRASRRYEPRAIVYSTIGAALLWPRPGAIRYDAPAAANRPGHHGIWQRPVERRRLREAPLLVPVADGTLAETPSPHAPAVVVPIPSRRRPTRARRRDIAAITYAADPWKKGLDRVLAAWSAARRDGEELGRRRDRRAGRRGRRARGRAARARRVPGAAAARAGVRDGAAAGGLRAGAARGAGGRVPARDDAGAGAVRGAADRPGARSAAGGRRSRGCAADGARRAGPATRRRRRRRWRRTRAAAVDAVVARELLPRLLGRGAPRRRVVAPRGRRWTAR